MANKTLQKAEAKRNASKKKGTYVGFKKLAAETSPATAAAIGRKKYGKAGFAALAKKGKSK